jgi:murein DD-endopeptidase MepM/ murein hydrolase activator NlpD
MDVILIRKNHKKINNELTHTLLVPSAFVSILTIATMASSAYYYNPESAKSAISTSRYTTQVNQTTTNKGTREEDLALRLERLQAETTRLNRLGKKLVNHHEVPDPDFSVSWDNDIANHANTSKTISSRQPRQLSLTRERFSQRPSIEEVKRSIRVVSENLLLRQYRSTPTSLPSGWPLKQGRISSPFGWRGRRMHKGIDIAAPTGTPIFAAEDGIVTKAQSMRGYGKMLEIKHGEMYSTRYGHNSNNFVKVGDYVRRGQLIGLVGSTGRSTGPHVHFEVLQSAIAINPVKYLAAMDSFKLSENIKLSDYVLLSQR